MESAAKCSELRIQDTMMTFQSISRENPGFLRMGHLQPDIWRRAFPEQVP